MADENKEVDLPVAKTDLYSAENELMEMSKEFFKVNDEDGLQLSKAKFSIFGYFTQAASYILKSSALHKNLLLDEFFLNTASLDSSIYNFAKLYSYDIKYAKPAQVQINLAISLDDLISQLGIDIANGQSINRKFRLQSNTKFNFGSFCFMLPCSIDFSISYEKDSLGKEHFSGFGVYNLSKSSEINLPSVCEEIKKKSENAYIKLSTRKVPVGTNAYNNFAIFHLTIYQIDMDKTESPIISSDLNQVIEFEKEFFDQLANIKVEVKEPNTENWITLILEYNNLVESKPDEKVIHYTNIAENKVRMYFGNSPEYRPPFGSDIRISIYTTKGKEGNFSYMGTGTNIGVQLSLVPIDDKVDTDEEEEFLVDLSQTKVYCVNDTSSTGGEDKLSVEEIKKELIRKILTRENLITDTDLNYFFNDLQVLASLNNGSIEFFKKRDDIIKRMFNAYILMRDEDGGVIPTNTINLSLSFDDLDKSDFMLKTGTLIIYDRANSIYRLLDETESVDDFINNDYFVYSLPFLSKVKVEGESSFPRVVFYQNNINTNLGFQLKEEPAMIGVEAILQNINIVRNSAFDQNYTFFVNMSYSTNYENVTDTDFCILLRLYKKGKNNSVEKYYCNMILIKDRRTNNTWYCDIKTDDIIDDNECLRISNVPSKITYMPFAYDRMQEGGLFMADDKNNYYDKVDYFTLGENVGVEAIPLFNIGCIVSPFQKNPFTTYQIQEMMKKYRLECMTNMLSTRSDGKFIIDLDNSPNSKLYIPLSSYVLENNETISLFHSMSELFCSDLIINNDGTFVIKELPVIGSQFFANRDRCEKMISLLKEYDNIINGELNKLEMNTTINIKFFNTYGYSKIFSSTKTNLNIELRIKSDSNSESMNKRIREKIVDIVDKSNSKEFLSFSDISRELLAEFNSIKYIDIVGINNVGTQVIEKTGETNINAMTKEEVKNYVPEYLNVNRQNENNTLNYCIDITYV